MMGIAHMLHLLFPVFLESKHWVEKYQYQENIVDSPVLRLLVAFRSLLHLKHCDHYLYYKISFFITISWMLEISELLDIIAGADD